MTGYHIEEISLQSKWREQIGSVVADAFGELTPEEAVANIELTTAKPVGTRQSAYFGAIEDDELIGFNAFIAHDLRLNGQPSPCYQSCGTATSSAHRGKRVFQNIILHAHEALASKGASHIIGWPNPNSEPLFVNKLGYRRETSLKRNIPGAFVEHFFAASTPGAPGIGQNDRELIALKRRRYGDLLFVVDSGEGLLWGVLKHRATKIGKVPYFAVGGISVAEPAGVTSLAKAMRKQLPWVAYWQIVTEARNGLNPIVGRFDTSTTNPFIWFPLGTHDTDPSFDFFAGIRDVF